MEVDCYGCRQTWDQCRQQKSDYSVWDLHRCALVIVSSRKHEVVRDDKRVFAESEAHGTRRCSTVADEAVTQIGESKWCRSINTNPWDTGRDKYFLHGPLCSFHVWKWVLIGTLPSSCDDSENIFFLCSQTEVAWWNILLEWCWKHFKDQNEKRVVKVALCVLLCAQHWINWGRPQDPPCRDAVERGTHHL